MVLMYRLYILEHEELSGPSLFSRQNPSEDVKLGCSSRKVVALWMLFAVSFHFGSYIQSQ